MWTALLLLGLAQAQEDAPSFTRPDRTAAAFVPVPGFPALLDRDWAGVGLSWAVAAPSTAAVAMISGQAASHPRQAVGMTLAGYYVATVAANRLFSGRALVAVGPTPGYSGISMEVQVAIPAGPNR
ncbi:MAG: hypothetical protein H6739_03390 [Alphaproteobacteria bacterium]|nr:hypothetical protein [Alphaproteobacteria bacterium]